MQGERMWVLVAGRRGGVYVGVLDNDPGLVERGDYLCRVAEVSFLPEHVIDIDDPPVDYAEARLAQPPERRWPPEANG